jgi:hypothetical protein
MKSYTRQKGLGYAIITVGATSLVYGLNEKDEFFTATGSLISALGFFTLMHAEVKISQAGSHFIKAKVYLNPGYLRIQW